MDSALSHWRERPSPDTPTSTPLFLSASQRVALQALQAGITAQRGFVVLLGADGLGKTTILRAALAGLNPQHYRTFPLPAPALSLQAVLAGLGQAYGCPLDTEDLRVMADRLRQALLPEAHQGRHVVLVIDDAHTLAVPILWNLRMLSDLMQTPTGYLIQIVLVGRPELDATLHRRELQPLRQRLTVRALLTPFTPQESLAYIHHCLARRVPLDTGAGAPQILARLVQDGHGNPRRLDRLCSTTLTPGAVSQSHPFATKTVQEVLSKVVSWPAAVLRLRWGMVSALGCLLSLGFLWFGPYNLTERFKRSFTPDLRSSPKTLTIEEMYEPPGSTSPTESFQTTSAASEPLLPTRAERTSGTVRDRVPPRWAAGASSAAWAPDLWPSAEAAGPHDQSASGRP